MILLALAVSATALACTGDSRTTVVGNSADEQQILVRYEQDAEQVEITLALVGVDGKQTKSWPILTQADEGDATVRSERWAAAEAELQQLGVTIDPHWKPSTLGSLGTTLTVETTEQADSDVTVYTQELVAHRGGWSRPMEHIGTWTSMDNPNARLMPSFTQYLLPSKKHLVLAWDASCSSGRVSVYPVADLVF